MGKGGGGGGAGKRANSNKQARLIIGSGLFFLGQN